MSIQEILSDAENLRMRYKKLARERQEQYGERNKLVGELKTLKDTYRDDIRKREIEIESQPKEKKQLYGSTKDLRQKKIREEFWDRQIEIETMEDSVKGIEALINEIRSQMREVEIDLESLRIQLDCLMYLQGENRERELKKKEESQTRSRVPF